MQSWEWALLLKPFAGLVVFAVLFGLPILIVRLLRPVFPAGRLKDWLFRQRGTHGAGTAASAGDSSLDGSPVIRGEIGQDGAGLRRIGKDL